MKKTLAFLFMCVGGVSSLAFSQNIEIKDKFTVEQLFASALMFDSTPLLYKSNSENLQGNILRVYSVTDDIIKSKINYSNDLLEHSALDSSNRIETTRASVGYSKGFLSGTNVSAEFYGTEIKNTDPLIPTTPGVYYDTGWNIALRQSLMKNGFGELTKNRLTLVQHQNIALKYKSKADIEGYLSSLVSQYFNGWLLIRNHQVALERSVREKRRLTIYESQYKRGFIEKTEYLQIKSSYLTSKSQADEVMGNIETVLIGLSEVVGTDLLSLFKKNQNILTGDVFDLNTLNNLCKKDVGDLFSYQMEALKHNEKIYSEEASLYGENAKPDLYVEARYDSNGVDKNGLKSLSETAKQENPKIALGIGLDIPLGGNSSDKADLYDLKKKQFSNEISKKKLMDSLSLVWKNQCHTIKTNFRLRQSLLERIDVERERVRLLDNDLSVGKVDINTLVLAENSLSQLLSALNQYEAGMNVSMWELKRLQGYYKTLIEKYMK